MKKEEYLIINDIINRAVIMKLVFFSRTSLMMDLSLAYEKFNLDLNGLLNAEDFDFVHDVISIQKHIDRTTKEFDGIFVPRFAVDKD
jgi:hypothetical protein